MKIGIVAALPGEVRPIARLQPKGRARLAGGGVLRLAGMGADNAARAADELAGDGVDLLASWGVAAALAPNLRPGALVLPEAVIGANNECLATDQSCRQSLRDALPAGLHVTEQSLVEATELLADPAAKRALYEHVGAVACDMESAAIATVAHKHGLGFIAIRAIVDDATMALPPVAQAAMGNDGRLRAGKGARALLRRPQALPGQLRSLRRLSAAYRAARLSLTQAATWLPPAS